VTTIVPGSQVGRIEAPILMAYSQRARQRLEVSGGNNMRRKAIYTVLGLSLLALG
jgi:hypothetical protein